MAVNSESYREIKKELDAKGITLVAVSKTKPVADILELYNEGQRDFGENYVQELVDKAVQLPADIHWHFIGHLQTNKVKLIAPFVQLVHGVDSLKLLKEINKEAGKQGRTIDCLLQIHIAREETKFGLDEEELTGLLAALGLEPLPHVRICGLMGMASFTEDMEKVKEEFSRLKIIYDRYSGGRWSILSMGMSSDYRVAAAAGSTMVRIGSLLFGERIKK
jgi:pyridoxal phosphate enzyme (YggS family)